MSRSLVALVIGITVLAAACGSGGGSDVAAAPATTAAPIAPPTSAPATASIPAPASSAPAASTPPTTARAASNSNSNSKELPRFVSDFARVCTTQVGFGGTTAYDRGATVHPVAVFENDGDDSGVYFETTPTLPAGWTVTVDPNATDNSALAAVQLVACVHRTATTPTGVQCNFDNNGQTVMLGLVDATYDVTVYAAASGEKLGDASLDAKTTDCPYVAYVKEGDTQYVSILSDDDVTNAVKPYVTPS